MSIVVHKNPKENDVLQPFIDGVTYSETASGKDAEHPVTCGIFTIAQDALLKLKFPFDDFVLVLEGEMHVEDLAKPGEIVSVKQGDLVHVEKDTSVKWSSPSAGTGFWFTQVLPNQDFGQYTVE